MTIDYTKLFVPWKEYAKERNFSDTFIYYISNSVQRLVFLGVRHSFDPTEHLFEVIRGEWGDFLKKTKSDRRLVFIEGKLRKNEASEELSIRHHGEGGLVTYLANRAGCEIVCPEPSESKIARSLTADFPKEDILYNRIASSMLHFFRPGMPSREEYVTNVLSYLQKTWAWPNFVFSYANIKGIHKKRFGSEFETADRDFFMRQTAPIFENGTYNEISRRESDIRDTVIVGHIKKYWDKGQSCFLVFGSAHAVRQEPALRSLLL